MSVNTQSYKLHEDSLHWHLLLEKVASEQSVSWAVEVEIDGVIASVDMVEVDVYVNVNGGTSRMVLAVFLPALAALAFLVYKRCFLDLEDILNTC